jgi:hypothetical protein
MGTYLDVRCALSTALSLPPHYGIWACSCRLLAVGQGSEAEAVLFSFFLWLWAYHISHITAVHIHIHRATSCAIKEARSGNFTPPGTI